VTQLVKQSFALTQSFNPVRSQLNLVYTLF